MLLLEREDMNLEAYCSTGETGSYDNVAGLESCGMETCVSQQSERRKKTP